MGSLHKTYFNAFYFILPWYLSPYLRILISSPQPHERIVSKLYFLIPKTSISFNRFC